MPLFHYTAVRGEGETYEGNTEAVDRFALYTQVRKEGGMILTISEGGGNNRFGFLLEAMRQLLGGVSTAEKIMLARNLATMVKAGLPLSRALAVMGRQSRSPALKRVLESVGADVVKGSAFHVTLAKFPNVFPSLFVAMVKAGEESGKLSEALSLTAAQLERSYGLHKKIRGAMIYPGIVISVMVIVGILMLMFVVPTLTATFKELNVELPRSTQAIIAVSTFLTEYTVTALLLILLVVVSVAAALRSKKGRRSFEWGILRIPVIRELVKETNAAQTARTLSSLLSAGVEVVHALSITGDVVQNSYFRAVLLEAEKNVERGAPISEAFAKHENLYPVLVGEMMAVGEETGRLSNMLSEIADFYESEVEQKTKDLSSVIEPFLMVVIGSIVGFFALSMISPIYSISSGI